MSRYVCIHGHFYQPPRENPWTGVIERQISAGEDHDWNCRIARECYVPNGAARIVNEKNEVTALVNNYASLSFNFGPTLFSWLEKFEPKTYQKILEADKESAARLGGHGNAIAQAYNHAILPLADARDAATQVRWGIADFRRRFGREPEALWIPECACNQDVLRLLIAHGLKYAILAPSQALAVRPLDSPQWRLMDQNFDPLRPYLWIDPQSQGKRSIALFFYHGGLSRAAAFDGLMSDSWSAASQIASAFNSMATAGEDHSQGPVGRSASGLDRAAEDELVSIVADGETYGHHQKFADMGLAHLVRHGLPDKGVSIVNYGWYLAKHPPQWQVEIEPGPANLGTSWSCNHGVARWTDECDCGSEGLSTKWKRPLREAFDFLRDNLAVVFEQEGGRYLRDPWEARDDYGAWDTLLNSAQRHPGNPLAGVQTCLDTGFRRYDVGDEFSKVSQDLSAFLSKHLKVKDSGAARQAVLRLMEMQKFAMFMYTSCGWFFSEISGLEAVQNMKYAARALELSRMVGGRDLEPEFIALLKKAPSNNPLYGDGAGVWRSLVAPSMMPEDGAVPRESNG